MFLHVCSKLQCFLSAGSRDVMLLTDFHPLNFRPLNELMPEVQLQYSHLLGVPWWNSVHM